MTAKRLDGLRALTRLRHLSIDSPRHITDFTPLLGDGKRRLSAG